MFTETDLEKVLTSAKNNEELDITSLAPTDNLVSKYEETSEGDLILTTKVTAKVNRDIDLTITIFLYNKEELIDSRLFFEHEKKELITTLQSWFI